MPIVRPPDVVCPKWEPASTGSKACRYYLKPGPPEAKCARCGYVEHDPEQATCPKCGHTQLMVEIAPRTHITSDGEVIDLPLEKQGPTPSGLCVLPSEMLCVEWVRRHGTPAQQQALGVPPLVPPTVDAPPAPKPKRVLLRTPFGELDVKMPEGFKPAKEIDPAGLEALERAGVEVELSAPYLGEDRRLAIVPERTGRRDREEITFREAATIRLLVDAFPGAHVTGYTSGKDSVANGVSSSLPRNPDGNINNCALACGDVESSCQMCLGACPDYARLGRSQSAPTNGAKVTQAERPFMEYPRTGTRCGVCDGIQRMTPGGVSCPEGHGGAEAKPGGMATETNEEEDLLS